MECEIIERLAIDSAAGELNEDTEALFRAYLAEHPELNEWADGMSLVYGETEAAVTKKTGAPDGDIKTEQMKINRPRINLWPVLRWAAVMIFAACIGAAAGRWSKSDGIVERPRTVAGAPDSHVRPSGISLENIGDGFWRTKAIAMLDAKPYHELKDYNQSNSLWEKYRQHIKETYNE